MNARGEYIAFTDGDCIVDREWLRQLEMVFTDSQIAGVGGDQLSPDDESELGKRIQDFLKTIGFVADYIKTDQTITESAHNPTCNVMYRKSVLDKIGGFNEELWPGEDVELDFRIKRAGFRLFFNPKAIVHHYRPTSYLTYARMMKRYGAAQSYLVRQYGRFRRIHYEPPVLIMALLVLIILTALMPEIWPICLLFPLAIVLFFAFKTGRIRKSFVYTFLFLITIFFWNLGFLRGYSRNRPVKQ